MGKFLAIDWGEKKIGLALSDELKVLARPYKAVKENFIDTIVNVIKEENIEKIILGRPRNMDGTLGAQAEKVSKFARLLEKRIDISLEYEDETNTTNIVKKMLIKEGIKPEKNRDLIDKKAAQLILQGYLNEKNK